MAPNKVTVEVEGRKLALSNLDKVLYPEAGFTKGEVIDYYVAVADVLLPHLAGPAAHPQALAGRHGLAPLLREERSSRHPDWVRTAFMAEHGDDGVTYVIADQLPTLVWLANLAALELHVPQWKIIDDEPQGADLLVFDLDPGPSGRHHRLLQRGATRCSSCSSRTA